MPNNWKLCGRDVLQQWGEPFPHQTCRMDVAPTSLVHPGFQTVLMDPQPGSMTIPCAVSRSTKVLLRRVFPQHFCHPLRNDLCRASVARFVKEGRLIRLFQFQFHSPRTIGPGDRGEAGGRIYSAASPIDANNWQLSCNARSMSGIWSGISPNQTRCGRRAATPQNGHRPMARPAPSKRETASQRRQRAFVSSPCMWISCG